MAAKDWTRGETEDHRTHTGWQLDVKLAHDEVIRVLIGSMVRLVKHEQPNVAP